MISSDADEARSKLSSIIERLDAEIKIRAEAARKALQEQRAEEQKQAEEAAKTTAPPQTAPPTTPPGGGITQESGTGSALDNAIKSVKAKPVQSGIMIVAVIVVLVLAFMLGKNALKGRKEGKSAAGKDRMGETIGDLSKGQVNVMHSGEAVIIAGSRFRGRG